jgi:hypothetical protein
MAVTATVPILPGAAANQKRSDATVDPDRKLFGAVRGRDSNYLPP